MTTATTTAIALAPQADLIASITERMRHLIPHAGDAPNDKIWTVAQLALAHNLDPFAGEVQLYRIGSSNKNWIADIGINGWRQIASRQSNYTHGFEPLATEEVQLLRGDNYDPGDRGCRCTLWRLDVARECKELGIPYEPVQAVGLYRVKAFFNKFGKPPSWIADTLPNCRSAEDVAERRAEKAALKKAFPMVRAKRSYQEFDQQINSWERDRHIEQAFTTEEPLRYEEDGDILFA